ncbi:SNF2 family N-terminal domain-containing protein [Xylogone sp. PMI_703]|nr:SNF2 family N-terminal domain-containing protein [Xylogone sp. PMI_703]
MISASMPTPTPSLALIWTGQISKKYGGMIVPFPMHHCRLHTMNPATRIQRGMEKKTGNSLSAAKQPSDLSIVQEPVVSPFDIFNGINNQMPLMGLNELDYDLSSALVEWENNILSQSFDSPERTPFSSQETSSSPSIAELNHSTAESAALADDEQTVCYGMLYNVDVKLVGEMQIIHSKLGESEVDYKRFKLIKEEEHIFLRFDDDGEKLGYLRSGTCKTLAPLLDTPYVKFEPIVSTFSLKEVIGQAKKSVEAMVKVDINVYGQRRMAANVGDALSSGKLWLQRPGHARSEAEYDNPHFLHLEINNHQLQPILPVSQVADQGLVNRMRRKERLRKMVEEVYKSLDSTRHLDMVDGGDMVTGKLLKHQQEALGFMLERETGQINNRYRLWVLEEGMEVYRHKITKTKAKHGIQPDERGGGILADEMGMGKSLSILALIVKTLDDGKEWVEHHIDGIEGKEALKHSHSTLIVVPSALLVYNWMNEIKKHLKEGLKVIKYHGSDRPKDLETISDSDIVITTYNTLTAEFQIKSKPSLLHRIGWYRVVLDEAHIIRRPATAFYHACCNIHANSRWCLTGTPIQNKLTDIGALFAFIRAEPFSTASIFRKWIEVPFEQNVEDSTVVKDRLIMLLEALCLRRTKEVIELPRLRQRLRELEFSAAEREQYENTKKILMRTIRHRVGEVEKSSKFGLFQVHLQMRLMCNHGTFQQHFSWHRRNYQEESEAFVSACGENGEITCSGCQQPMPILGSSQLGNGFIEQCAHVLCSECMEESITPSTGAQGQHCPVCVRWPRHRRVEGAIRSGSVKEIIEDDTTSYFNTEGYSTKMRVLIEDVSQDLWQTKSIIFSCWTKTLHLLAKHLDEAKIPYLRIDGGCPLLQRQAKLDQFSNDKERPVLIMTTGTGGFGLNLTCANRVFIVELQWNPGVESQAIARAIRLGQENEVLVTRYVIKDTVEEEMRSQQQWKKQLAALGFEEMPDAIIDEENISQ